MFSKQQGTHSKCKCCKDIIKQQVLVQQQNRQESQIEYECQPLLTRHPICNYSCLDFKKYISGSEKIKITFPKVLPLPLKKCKQLIQQIITHKKEIIEKKKTKTKPQSLSIRRRYFKSVFPLTQDQREKIVELQQLKYRNSVISAILCISPSQVRQNKIRSTIIKYKEQIKIPRTQSDWLIKQASFQSNRSLFNARQFSSEFIEQFPNQRISISQFRKILHGLNIRYRIPSLKPLQFFNKYGKSEEMNNFVAKLCGYVFQQYKLIFIDECSLGNISQASHKQWHVVGTFKEITHRISNFKYLIGSLGDDCFLQYQIFSGTGKGFIFRDFLVEVIKKAQVFYSEKPFVLILDGCSIHKSSLVNDIYEEIPHVYTPAYRPEFNAIEHMFGWIKRKIVSLQPSITSQFIYQIHQTINQIDDNLMYNWCGSVYRPILNELQWI